ncbi:5'-methylthioadenosine/S-adenosylhomocysteine nucleosidase [Bacillus sp. 1P06AnD]|uniref:5'-methylthioadenosine/S-adenosylhomocysteine nucleosidase n=1 Tax=Bacillus sp. 1P06AnD TaxID=3132208 RepID=UPI0039A3C85F
MKIAIIGAMEEEVTILRNQMEHVKQEIIANCEFTSGLLAGVDVILLKSGIGKVNAAMSTTILLDRYNPDAIINTGSAGGFSPDLKVGDVVVSTEVVHHDVDATIFGYAYGQVPQMPAAYPADAKLIEIAEKAAQGIEGTTVVKGMIATGDSFMDDPERVGFVRNKFADLQAAEMEAAAIAQVSYQFNKPFVVIRALSDIAGKESNISFDKFLETAAVNSSKMVISFLKEIAKK